MLRNCLLALEKPERTYFRISVLLLVTFKITKFVIQLLVFDLEVILIIGTSIC